MTDDPLACVTPPTPIDVLKGALHRATWRPRRFWSEEYVTDVSVLQDALWELEHLRQRERMRQMEQTREGT